MKIEGIDTKRCTACLSCVKDCPADLFSVIKAEGEQERAPSWDDPNGWCLGCGHCLAVCPSDAVLYKLDAGEEPFRAQAPTAPLSFEQVLALLTSRRSVRRYKKREVSEQDLGEVLEAMRYAPSGHNVQSCEIIVLRDRDLIRRLADLTIARMRGFLRMIRLRYVLRPFVPRMLFQIMNDPKTAKGIRTMAAQYAEGRDVIFFDAPMVLVVTYPRLGEMSLIDPTIATTYGLLAAHARGLGACWMGFAQDAMRNDKRAARLLDIPPDRTVGSVFTLGHPATAYRRVPPRKASRFREVA